MPFSPNDARYMARAIQLARQGIYTTRQNPRVGAVIVANHQIIGEGWHHRPGQPHAEIIALNAIADGQLADLRGATCYVSLEPCCHQGKTPPCTDALIKAGIARLVYGHEDPNPLVAGQGLEKLRAAGISVEGPLLDVDARTLNPGFNKRMVTGLPWIRIKSAASLDGRTAMADGHSFWITGPQARADVQRLRARSCAVITSFHTVDKDQASLTLRPDEFNLREELGDVEQPLRVLVDAAAALPVDAPFFKAKSPILVVTALSAQQIAEQVSPQLIKQDHIEFISLPQKPAGTDQSANHPRVDLAALVHYLGDHHINEVLVEAGAKLSGAFLRQALVDELLVYMAPKLMGSKGLPLFDLPLNAMDEALPLHIDSVTRIGRDMKIRLLPELE